MSKHRSATQMSSIPTISSTYNHKQQSQSQNLQQIFYNTSLCCSQTVKLFTNYYINSSVASKYLQQISSKFIKHLSKLSKYHSIKLSKSTTNTLMSRRQTVVTIFFQYPDWTTTSKSHENKTLRDLVKNY